MNNISFTKIFEIFFFGMAFQFIAHTFVTYTLQLPDTGIFSVIRARKEILVLMLGIICLFQLQKEKKIQLLWTDKDNRRIL